MRKGEEEEEEDVMFLLGVFGENFQTVMRKLFTVSLSPMNHLGFQCKPGCVHNCKLFMLIIVRKTEKQWFTICAVWTGRRVFFFFSKLISSCLHCEDVDTVCTSQNPKLMEVGLS